MAASFGKSCTYYMRCYLPVFTARRQQNVSLFKRFMCSVVSVEKKIDNVVEYPPIKPKFPPGLWGSIDRSYAWMWWDLKNHLLDIPNAQDRMNVFLHNPTDIVILQPGIRHPASLDFRKFVTKTAILPWNESESSISHMYTSSTNDVEEVMEELKKALHDQILMEHDGVLRDTGSTKPEDCQKHACRRILHCISDTILAKLSAKMEHIRLSQLDEDVIVRALWDCCQIARKDREGEVSYSTLEDILAIVDEKDERVMSEVLFDMVIRGHNPLPQIEPRTLSSNTEVAEMKYKLQSYGHSHQKQKKCKSILAGHKPGDPCEFGLLGFVNTCDTNDIEDTITLKVAKDCRLALGVTSAFTWLAAQAFNQGFNHVVDLTYPLTSQVVLTDGHRFSFLLYQLNTLSLWQDREANKLANLCWHTQEMPLFHSIENGQVREFNDDALKIMVQMFLLAPADRGYDMKPTLAEKAKDLHLKSDFIPERVVIDEIIEEEKYIV